MKMELRSIFSGVNTKVFLFFCLFMMVGIVAHAQYATGGSSPYRDQVLWLTWGGGENGTSDQPLNEGASSGATIQLSGSSILDVTCSITDVTHSGGGDTQLYSYRPGDWSGDVLDDLYNIGGTGSSNQLINGISRGGGVSDFTIGCTATLDGEPFDLNGIVMADAEAINTTSEYVEATAEGIWNVVEMAQNSGAGSYIAQKTNNGDGTQTIRFGPGTDNETAAVTFLSFTNPSSNVSMDFSVDGGGVTAIAIGILAPYSDYGDAPASYGNVMHLVQDLQFLDDNLLADGSQHDLNDTTYEPGGLAPSEIDYIGSEGPDTELEQQYDSNAEGDDNYPASGSIEEDAWPDNYTITVLQEGETLSESIACTGSGSVAGWIDFDRNGTFDSDERAEASCSGGTVDLSWTISSDLTAGMSYVRLRYSTDPAEIANPMGIASDGEVEDHVIEVLAPELSVTKGSNAAGDTWDVGEQNAQYTLTVTNNGPVATGNPPSTPVEPVTVRDQLPTGIEPDWTGTRTSNGWSCSYSGQDITCTTSDLIAASGQTGDTSVFQLPVQVTGGAIGGVTNYASVAGGRDPFNDGSAPDPGPSCSDADHCTEYTVTVAQTPELTVTKELTNAPSPIVGGSELEYTITATNSGNVTLSNVEINDPMLSPDTEPCGTLDVGDDCTLTGTYTVTSSDVDAGEVVNTATATGDDPTGDPVEDNDQLTESIPLADLAVSKSVDNPTPNVGEDIIFSVSVTNNGSAEATNVSITDQLPTGYSYVSATASQGNYSDGTGIWDIGTIANGASATLEITATVLASGNYKNTASVSGVDQEDPDDSNNSSTSETTPSASADIEIEKTLDTDGPFNVGQEVQYTLLVTNNGPSEATNIEITDTPTNLTIDNVSGSGCNSFPCIIPSLANGSTTTISVTGTVQEEGAFGNTATAEADEEDSNPDNNTDNDGDSGNTSADVAITKVLDTSAPYSAGQEVAYSLTLSNSGPSDATGILVEENPTNLTITSVSGSGCSSFPCTVANLAEGDQTTISVMATIDEAGSFDNEVTVTPTENDPNEDNNTSNDGGTGDPTADITINKTLDTEGPYVAGQEINYTLTVSNAGPSEATGIEVTDTPTNLSITEVSGAGCSSFPCTIEALRSDEETSISVTATIDEPGTFTNTATVETETPDPEPDDNTDDDPDNGGEAPSADVSLNKTLYTEGPYVAGQEVNYTLTVSNAGPSEATDVVVEENTTNLAITNVTGSGCSNFPCTLGTLTAGGEATITVTATIEAAGAFDNAATATPAEDDPSSDNNTDDKNNGGKAAAPELQITKQAENLTAQTGGFVPYTITIDNLSDVPVSGVQLVDTPAPGLSYVGQSLGVADADNAGLVEGLRPLRISQIDVPAGGQATISYVMRVGATALPGELRNVAHAAWNGAPISSEDEASVILEGDPMMDETRILGTVFRDHDRDGWQDKATATHLHAQGGFTPDAYVPGSTTIDRGKGPEAVPDGSAPLLNGLDLGDLGGRNSVDAEPGQVVIRQRLRAPELTDDFTLTSDEGSRLRLDASGTIHRDRQGALKRGANSQRLEVDRTLEELDNGQYQLSYRISNAGYDDWGLPGARLATPRGLMIETDGYGRYHIEAIQVDSWRRGRNYVVKVDGASLPRGSRYTTENPLVRRVTQGLPVRFDFGVWWPSADVSITKTLVADSSYHPGQQVTYRLTVANDGPTEAEDIRLSDRADNLTMTDVRGGGCQTLPCLLPEPLAPGQQQQLTVLGRIDSVGGFINTATVWASQPDPLPGNNSDQVIAEAIPADTVAPPPPAPCAGAEVLAKAVHFETDKALLVPASEQMLDQLAVFLRDRQECSLQVTGHTDHDLGHDYNQDLSDRRAEAIVAYLKAAGVPEQRMSYTGLSYDDPAVEEIDVLDKARNRRASFTLHPDEDSAAALRPQIEDLQVDPEPRAWDYVFDFRHNAVPTRLHFPAGSAELNFVSEYLLKRISLVFEKYPDVTVTFAIPASGDAGLDERREEALQQILVETGLTADQYHIVASGDTTGPVEVTYTPNDELILVDQADDIRLAGDEQYRPLLEKALHLLEGRRDGPLLNDSVSDLLDTMPKDVRVQPKSKGLVHQAKADYLRFVLEESSDF